MLLTTIEELNALLPANVSCNATRLLALMEQTAESYLRPILGQPLFHAVCRAYQDIADNADEGIYSILPNPSQPVSEVKPEVRLIRPLQVPLVYMTLANNASLLSVSLNDGGLNAVSAEGYDAISKEDREAFARDCYLNAHRGIERILLFLEEDARSATPVFLPLWQESTSFYQQNDILLRTAADLDRYVSINESRETYLTFLPSIRRAQENYLRPELGDQLTDALIAYAVLGPQARPTADSESPQETDEDAADNQEPSETPDAEKTFAEKYADDFDPATYVFYPDTFLDLDALRPHLPIQRAKGNSAEEIHKYNAWCNALRLAQITVAYYAEDDSKKYRRTESRNDAMRTLARLKDFVAANTAAFEGVIETSPLFTPVATTYNARNPQLVQDEAPTKPESPGYVHDPFGTFYL
jgi:hypothetical protein